MNEREAFARRYDVSRGTLDKFDRYATLLGQAAASFNIVGRSTLPHLWERHFADCAQLLSLGPKFDRWLDLGSGAGFPGLVLALLGARVDLVEAQGKKAAFLQLLVDELQLNELASVRHSRLETLPLFEAPVITARAFAAIPKLLDFGMRFSSPRTLWILLKGSRVNDELRAATRDFDFEVRFHQSRTSPDGRIVILRSVTRKARSATLHR